MTSTAYGGAVGLDRGMTIRDVYAAALRGAPCTVHGWDVDPRELDVAGWGSAVDVGDLALLRLCRGPTLDVGCGPGRLTEHLARAGVPVLGIDVAAEAVRQARSRGGAALVRDVFKPLPGEGRWGTVLLADGNIGIGGNPLRLLRRLRELLDVRGRVVTDLARPGRGVRTASVTLECAGLWSDPFPWAAVGPEAVPGLAESAGFDVTTLDSRAGRWHAVLSRRR